MASPSPAPTTTGSAPQSSSSATLSPFATWRSGVEPPSFPASLANPLPVSPSGSTATAPILPPPVMPSTPIFGLHGRYSNELRDRPEWVRIGPVVTALGTMTEGAPHASKRDFYFELTYQSTSTQSFAGFGPVKVIKLSALLLTPASFEVANRRQTAATIQKFAETNKTSMEVILYLMDSRASGGQQIEAVQSLGALHHCLSLGYTDAPPVLVVSDAAYLTDCIESYMKSLFRAKASSTNTVDQQPVVGERRSSVFEPVTASSSGVGLATPRAPFFGSLTPAIKTEYPGFTQARK